MKKLLTAILVVAMIASIASVAAFAAEYQPVTLTAEAVTVEEGATEAVVPVKVSNPNSLGLSAVMVTAKVEGTEITSAVVPSALGGSDEESEVPAAEVRVLWANTKTGCPDAEFVIAEFTVAIPEGAKAGDVITVEVVASDDVDNYQSFDVDPDLDDTVGYGATAVNGSITITEKAADPTEPVDSETEPTGSETEPAGTETKGADETKKADDGKKAPQTGDVAIIVVAAMIVALGTAIVVKKVNVK